MQHYAFGLAKASEIAIECGLPGITVIEFGVAAGRGLMNLYSICELLKRETGLEYSIVGFDSGRGMPSPVDFRDHPDLYSTGDFPMNVPLLQNNLPSNVQLLLGDVSRTVEPFLNDFSGMYPIGFISFDLDYYSSTISALEILTDSNAEKYLPRVPVYFDDISEESHNPWAGEQLAIKEFNERSGSRKLAQIEFIQNNRIFKNAWWLRQMYFMHVLDYNLKGSLGDDVSRKRTIENPYLSQNLQW